MVKNLSANPEISLRILVVGRETLTGYLLADALGRQTEYDASAIAASQLMPAIAARKPDLVLISADLHERPGHGMELADAVNRRYPGILIVLLLDQPNRESVISAFRCGARGIFSGLQSTTELFACIEHVRKGGIWAGKMEADYLLEALKSIPAPNPPVSGASSALTRRESQVVHCAAQGKTNKAIARELSLSEHTVKNYLFRAFEKLGVSSRVELLFYLTTQGQGHGAFAAQSAESKPPRSSYRHDAAGQQAR